MHFDSRDPLRLCGELPEEYKSHCYGNFKWALFKPYIETLDSSNFLSFIGEIAKKYGADEDYMDAAVWSFSYELARKSIKERDREEEIASCMSLQAPFTERCIQGFAVGLAKNGYPESQYIAVKQFCREARAYGMSSPHACPEPALRYLKGVYHPQKFRHICTSFLRSGFKVTCD